MKKKLFGVLATIVLILSMAFKYSGNDLNKNYAEVDQINGCYLFVNSKPVLPYEYLGTVEITKKDARKYLLTDQYQAVRDLLIKKIKEQYPNAEGIIFDFHDGGTDKADALRFK
ncbi:MAG: hypothetical protein KGM16_11215 [Bacteroidota bacterium]|nr:hypothetical protein [Bacteroidota bacterium]